MPPIAKVHYPLYSQLPEQPQGRRRGQEVQPDVPGEGRRLQCLFPDFVERGPRKQLKPEGGDDYRRCQNWPDCRGVHEVRGGAEAFEA